MDLIQFRSQLELLKQRLPLRPSFVASFFVAFANSRIVRLARAHETVTGAFVNNRLVFFCRRLSLTLQLWEWSRPRARHSRRKSRKPGRRCSSLCLQNLEQ